MTRREWLQAAGKASAVGWLASRSTGEAIAPRSEARLSAPRLRSFVDPLPIPPVITHSSRGTTVPIRVRPCVQKVHRDLPPTRLWGYDGSWPGPTIDVQRGQPLAVEWINELPTRHFLPIDQTIHGAGSGVPAVRAVTHVHGARTLPESDGHPDAWSTSDGRVGRYYTAGPSHYPNDQPATTLWYHDHALGITRLNIYAGLAGFYLIRDAEEAALNLPRGPFEIPVMLQDRQFNPDGSLLYPTAQHGTHPIWIQEFFGDTICVNGKAMPFLAVEPRRYRLRLVNGSNSRFYRLTIVPADADGQPSGPPGLTLLFHQIGTDGGLLPVPVALRSLVVAPGERCDLLIDFTGHMGARFVMLNDAPAPYARGGGLGARDVMLFTVTKPLSGPDESRLPDRLTSITLLNPDLAVRERLLAITEIERASDGYTVIGMLGQKHWTDPITEDPQAGSMEVWTFVNATEDVHPMHTHLVRFQVLNHQRFDVGTYLQTGTIVFASPPLAVEANERPAWKDTVKTYPGYLTRVVQRFDPPLPSITASGSPSALEYVWHCHMLEHEDNEMMRPYKVVGPFLPSAR